MCVNVCPLCQRFQKFHIKACQKIKELPRGAFAIAHLTGEDLTRADDPGSQSRAVQDPASSPGLPLQPRSILAPSPPPQDGPAGLGLPLVVQGSPHPSQLPARTYSGRSGQRELEGWTSAALAGSEPGLPELGKTGLSRTRQALGEGAQRDRTQLWGTETGDGDKRVIRDSGATVIRTAGAPESTSRDSVTASRWRPRPPAPP